MAWLGYSKLIKNNAYASVEYDRLSRLFYEVGFTVKVWVIQCFNKSQDV